MLSIIVPAFNSENFIRKCLESIQKSSHKDFELIVVDDASSDKTPKIAAQFTDHVISLHKNHGVANARNVGAKIAKGDILVFIDSDVVVFPETLDIILSYFEKNPDINAVTGLLSKTHPNTDFCSQYKNLYMNYTFHQLPDRINFLYGSIFAVKRASHVEVQKDIPKTSDDTWYGQLLVRKGEHIGFCEKLEVIHLKEYTLDTLVKNDYTVPYGWARIFIKFKGWKQLGKNGTGFAHAPQERLLSIIVAPLACTFLLLSSFVKPFIPLGAGLIVFWGLLNFFFLKFMFKEKGLIFGLKSVIFTFIDHLIMAYAVFVGLISAVKREIQCRKK